jgi:AhpD family alkylhydroperoxidase
MMLRESLVATGRAGRGAKEAVAAAVSLANQCPYCVEVHGSALVGLLRSPDAQAVAGDRIPAVADPQLRAVAQWARTGHGAAVPADQAPELIAVAVTFHYLNRMVNLFLPPSPLPPGLPGALRRGVGRLAVRLMGRLARTGGEPGASLPLLPAAPLPRDLSWAAGRDTVAEAFARAGAAVDAAGHRSVPEAVRRLVRTRVAAGDGPGPDVRGWLDEGLAALPPADHASGRLALLTAFASYRVTPATIDAYREQGHGDQGLIELTSWASLAAARHAGSTLARGLGPTAGLAPRS